MDRLKHIVGFSGGIDSQACALWVRNRYGAENVILTNSDAGGWEDPITIQFVADYSRDVFPVVSVPARVKDLWKTPGFAETKGLDGEEILTFELMCVLKGRPPSRKAQFCTEKLKLAPQKRWIAEMFGPSGPYAGEEYCRYTGVRRDESGPRNSAEFEGWDTWFDCELYRPIADWTKKMCFDYVTAHGEEYNPLYKMGFNRVGCAPCINSSKADILNWAIRRPEMIDKVRGLEGRTGQSFFHPMRRDGVRNNVDEAIAWARTPRGGSSEQELFPIVNDRPACESKYGLCE